MKGFALACIVLLAGISALATTNLPPDISLLLDEKTTVGLTAGLVQYENPPIFSGKITSIGGGSSAILVNRWAAEFSKVYPDMQGGIADDWSRPIPNDPVKRPV